MHNGKAGFSKVVIAVPDGVAMAGYSIGGKVGRHHPDDPPLFARAAYLEDAAGQPVVLCVLELWAASTKLLERIVAAVADPRIGVHNVVLMGVHTHTAPGHFMGSTLYNTLAQAITTRARDGRGDMPDVVEALVAAARAAIRTAMQNAVPARYAFQRTRVPGAHRNRSLGAFKANVVDAAEWHQPGHPGEGLADLVDPARRAADARLPLLSFWSVASGELLGVFGTFACHATALGHEHKTYHGDWPAIAMAHAEALRTGAVAMIGLSGAGDGSSIPPKQRDGYDGPEGLGREMARFVGERVGGALLDALDVLPGPGALEPISVEIALHRWRPSKEPTVDGDPHTRLDRWRFGLATIAGSEESRTCFHPTLAREGRVSDHWPATHPQNPKAPALGFVQPLLGQIGSLSLSGWHPIHLVKLGRHALVTLPGEPTAAMAWQVESALQSELGVPVLVVGYAGDYVGYFTTLPEYLQQHYEGASTLLGRYTGRHLLALTRRLALAMKHGVPFAAPSFEGRGQPFGPSVEAFGDSALEALPASRADVRARGFRIGSRLFLQPDDASLPGPALTATIIDSAQARHVVALQLVRAEPAPTMWAEGELPAAVAPGRLIVRLDGGAPFVVPVVAEVPDDDGEFAEPGAPLSFEGVAEPSVSAEAAASRVPPAEAPADLGAVAALIESDPEGTLADARAFWRWPELTLDELRDAVAGARVERSDDSLWLTELAAADDPIAALEFPGYDRVKHPIRWNETKYQAGNKGEWIRETAGAWLAWKLGSTSRFAFRSHRAAPSSFVYRPFEEHHGDLRVGLFADFATGTWQSHYVAVQLARKKPDLAVHLGDIYYKGTLAEARKYLLAPLTEVGLVAAEAGDPPRTPLFLLSGNHEMMTGGKGYIAAVDHLAERHPAHQEGSYFCIRYDNFQLIGLDTDYFGEGRCPDGDGNPQVAWLKERLAEGRDQRLFTVLLTQHVPYEFAKAGQTDLFQDLYGRLDPALRAAVTMWIWGDKHYATLNPAAGKVGFVGACIGHAGHPIDRGDVAIEKRRHDIPPVWVDRVPRFPPPIAVRREMGRNGFCVMTLETATDAVRLEYVDWLGGTRCTARVVRRSGGVAIENLRPFEDEAIA